MPFDQTVFDEIEAKIQTLEIDAIKQLLNPIMIGYRIESPVFNAGAFVYRARKLGPQFRKEAGISGADLVYPPAAKTIPGRLNRTGRPVFYGSMHKEAVFFEVSDLNAGDELVLSFWKTTERMFVNNVGYTEYAFEKLGAKRPLPEWTQRDSIGTEKTLPLATLSSEVVERAMSKDESRDFKAALSKYFTRTVNKGEEYYYKMTTAIGELHLGSIKNQNADIAGVIYPSVRMWANGDNIGIQPSFVDHHLEFRKAVHVRIKEIRAAALDIDYLDAAHEFDERGNLRWLGRLQNWTLNGSATAIFEPGVDADGDYYVSTDGQAAHWVIKDGNTGEVIAPA